MTWVILGETINGEPLYGRVDEDGEMRVTCLADYPELVAWIEDGNTPKPYVPAE